MNYYNQTWYEVSRKHPGSFCAGFRTSVGTLLVYTLRAVSKICWRLHGPLNVSDAEGDTFIIKIKLGGGDSSNLQPFLILFVHYPAWFNGRKTNNGPENGGCFALKNRGKKKRRKKEKGEKTVTQRNIWQPKRMKIATEHGLRNTPSFQKKKKIGQNSRSCHHWVLMLHSPRR